MNNLSQEELARYRDILERLRVQARELGCTDEDVYSWIYGNERLLLADCVCWVKPD